jgi:hypothetical protein
MLSAMDRSLWLPADEDRRSAYLTDDDEIVFYCRECAEREFGGD